MAKSVSTSQAAQELKMSRQNVGYLIKRGELSAERVGSRGWWRVQLPDKKEGSNP